MVPAVLRPAVVFMALLSAHRVEVPLNALGATNPGFRRAFIFVRAATAGGTRTTWLGHKGSRQDAGSCTLANIGAVRLTLGEMRFSMYRTM